MQSYIKKINKKQRQSSGDTARLFKHNHTMDKTTDKLYGYAGKFKLGCRMLDNPTHLRPKDEETKIEYFRKLGQYNGTPERQS